MAILNGYCKSIFNRKITIFDGKITTFNGKNRNFLWEKSPFSMGKIIIFTGFFYVYRVGPPAWPGEPNGNGEHLHPAARDQPLLHAAAVEAMATWDFGH